VVTLALSGIGGLGVHYGVAASWGAIGLAAVLSVGYLVEEALLRRTRPKTKSVSTDRHHALVVSLVEERLDVFNHQAWILKLKLAIRNRDRVQHRITSWQLMGVHGAGGVIPGLQNEIDRQRRDHPALPNLVEAGKTVEGWYLARIGYTPVDGPPNYQLTLQTETGNDYGFDRIQSPKREIKP
jgi:hypothetical protein